MAALQIDGAREVGTGRGPVAFQDQFEQDLRYIHWRIKKVSK